MTAAECSRRKPAQAKAPETEIAMKPRILIVDDSEINLKVLDQLLNSDYELCRARSGLEALAKIRQFSPDLVVLDIMMPGLDGYETCRQIKAGPLGAFTPVILVSAKASTSERLQGYEAGADDYLVKPFDHDELLAKVRIHFRLRSAMEDLWKANGKIHQFNCELERMVSQQTTEVVATRDIAIFALAKLAESRDPETGEHLERMRNYCRILAEELHCQGPWQERTAETFVDDIYRSSPLHDIGKVGIPDAILLKPGRLTSEEFDIMKRHTVIGATALEEAVRYNTSGGFLTMAIDIARHHHERFDGHGYPDGLAGEAIPLSARVVAVADVYDALTSARVYKPAYDPELARQMIEEEEGLQFDPAVVTAFRRRYDEILELHQAIQASEALREGAPMALVAIRR
jgi:putative two-component system response regulator